MKHPASDWQKLGMQFFRYSVAGGAAFMLDFSLFAGLTIFTAIPYLYAAAMAFLAGLALAYVLSIRWAFEHRSSTSASGEFAVFAMTGLAGAGLNEILIWYLTDKAGLHHLAAKLFTAAWILVLNFTSRKVLLFSRRMPADSLSN